MGRHRAPPMKMAPGPASSLQNWVGASLSWVGPYLVWFWLQPLNLSPSALASAYLSGLQTPAFASINPPALTQLKTAVRSKHHPVLSKPPLKATLKGPFTMNKSLLETTPQGEQKQASTER